MDAFGPQENGKQRLSIFAKEIDVLVDITEARGKSCFSVAPQLLSGYPLTWSRSGFFHDYNKGMLSFPNSLFRMPLKKDNEVPENNRLTL